MSTVKEIDVKMKSEVIGTVEVTIYDTTAEILEAFEEKKIVQMINAQNRANIANKFRESKRPAKAGKKKLFKDAYAYCNEKYPDELRAAIGDFDALQALVESKIPEMQEALGIEVIE